jgi:hypothetical protein
VIYQHNFTFIVIPGIVIHNLITERKLHEANYGLSSSGSRPLSALLNDFLINFSFFRSLLFKCSETSSDSIRRTLESPKVKAACSSAAPRKDRQSRLCRGGRTARQWTWRIPRGKQQSEEGKSKEFTIPLCCAHISLSLACSSTPKAKAFPHNEINLDKKISPGWNPLNLFLFRLR